MLMLVYAKVGKFRHRERILDLARLAGGETVVDVGTGRGLLAIGAAKRLTSGQARSASTSSRSRICRATRSSARVENVDARGRRRPLRDPPRRRAHARRSPTAASTSSCRTCACTTSIRAPSASGRSPRSRACSSRAGARSSRDFVATASYRAFFRARGFSVTRRTCRRRHFPAAPNRRCRKVRRCIDSLAYGPAHPAPRHP